MQGRKQVAFSGGHDKMEDSGLREKVQSEVLVCEEEQCTDDLA